MKLSQPVEDLEYDAPTQLDHDGRTVLTGSRCAQCGTGAFPARGVCYACGAGEVTHTSLGRRGHLYSWARVHVSASRPTPYDVAYVDLVDEGEGVRVFGQLVGGEAWEIGQDVELVLDADTEWAFAAAGGPR